MKFFSLALLLFFSTTQGALAHGGEGVSGGFAGGFWHPLSGLDHITAMVAVGILGAFLGFRARWALPVLFPVVMVVGGALGILGVEIPFVEIGIALSSVILGACIAVAPKNFPFAIAAVLVSIFAIFHGHAHGTEMGENTNALAYAIGFVIATGLLHLAGIAFGYIEKVPFGTYILRIAGGLIALAGIGFLGGWL